MEAVVTAMRGHTEKTRVHDWGCNALGETIRAQEEDTAHQTQARNAGAVEALVIALREHPDDGGVQEWACWALFYMFTSCQRVREDGACMSSYWNLKNDDDIYKIKHEQSKLHHCTI